jgi:hypothetical protein
LVKYRQFLLSNILNYRDVIKSSDPSNRCGHSYRSDANNSRDESNSSHVSKSRDASIGRNDSKKESATVPATERKQSTARKKTSAGTPTAAKSLATAGSTAVTKTTQRSMTSVTARRLHQQICLGKRRETSNHNDACNISDYSSRVDAHNNSNDASKSKDASSS